MFTKALTLCIQYDGCTVNTVYHSHMCLAKPPGNMLKLFMLSTAKGFVTNFM